MKKLDVTLFLVVLLKLEIVVPLSIDYAPVIETNKGPVRGTVLKTVKRSQEYFAYRNIRYAEAPVGYLRFKPPVEVDPWTEVLDASKDGPICPQIINGITMGQEDCLNLNVYTPKIPEEDTNEELKAVMVWIYGGAFSTGSNRKSWYSPDYLIEEGVVFVSVNYRLGPLGFMALGHPNATGNAALKDQNLALKWVRDNIAKFGGDPKKVTIFGQSAGGVSVNFHMLSERSRGLFHGSIAMSGTPLAIWGFHKPEEARDRGFKLGKNLGHETTSADSLLQFFYQVDAKSLVEMASNLTFMDLPFKPTVEDPSLGSEEDLFLTECPIKKYKSGNFAQVPHMMGYTKDEALAFTTNAKDLRNTLSYLFDGVKQLGMETVSHDLSDSIVMAAKNLTDIAIFTDVLFIAPIDYTQKLLSKSKRPIYFYRYSYEYENSPHTINGLKVRGAAHSDEIPMLFYSDYTKINPNSNDTRELVQRRMTRLWTNFAKFGNPTPEGTDDKLLNVVWPDSRSSGKTLEISDKLEARSRFSSVRIEAVEVAIRITCPKNSGCTRSQPHIFDIPNIPFGH